MDFEPKLSIKHLRHRALKKSEAEKKVAQKRTTDTHTV